MNKAENLRQAWQNHTGAEPSESVLALAVEEAADALEALQADGALSSRNNVALLERCVTLTAENARAKEFHAAELADVTAERDESKEQRRLLFQQNVALQAKLTALEGQEAAVWVPLKEDTAERGQFEMCVEVHGGDVRLAIASALEIWSAVHPSGSYGQQCRIMANAVAKLYLAAGAVQPASAAVPEGWRPDLAHAANEWADAACNGVQWVKNIRDGISTPESALESMEDDLKHCREVGAQARSAPQPPTSAKPMTDAEYQRMTERGAVAWAGVDPRELREGAPARELSDAETEQIIRTAIENNMQNFPANVKNSCVVIAYEVVLAVLAARGATCCQ